MTRTRAFLLGTGLFVVLMGDVFAHSSFGQDPRFHRPIPGLKEGAVARFERLSGAVDEELLLQQGTAIARPGFSGAEAALPQALEDNHRSALGPHFRPDRMTRFEGEANYHSSFSPSVAPFKRYSALDRVVMDGATPVLVAGDDERIPVFLEPSGATTAAQEDAFYGRVRLDFSEGRANPIPTVAPRARFLWLEAHPPLPLVIERDAAGNHYVLLGLGGRERRPVDLTFLTVAPAEYFAPKEIPEVPTGTLASHVFPHPEPLRRQTARVRRLLGLRKGMPYRAALERLTEHFRSFEEADARVRPTGPIYLELATGGIGVCRHRAYAFVITAQSLGIPAHFVMNEAHAFVEVEVPEVGFVRIDLGGAEADFHDLAAEARVPHRPRYRDPLPRPLAYREALARVADRVRRVAGAEAGLGLRGGSAEGMGTGASGSVATEVGGPARVQLFSPPTEVLRGSQLRLAGRVDGVGGSVASKGVRLRLSLAGPSGRPVYGVGEAQADAQGRFSGTIGVPLDTPVGTHSLQVTVVDPGLR